MLRKAVCFMAAAMIVIGNVPHVSAQDSLESMVQLSEEFYTLTKTEDWTEARNTLWKLTNTFSRHNWKDADLSVEGLHALSDALIQAKRALTKANPDGHEILMHGIRVRLGFDALENREQPLWHRYYSTLKQDVAQLKDAVPTEEKTEIQQSLDRLYAHYHLIQPALYVSRTPEVIERVDALFTYMEEQIHGVTVNRQQLQQAVEQWEKLIPPLFYGTDAEVLAVGQLPEYPIHLTTWLLAVLIGGVLTYVVWRKAQGEQVIRL